jgi:hypothetical protein
MVAVTVYDQNGEPYASQNLNASKADVMQALNEIHDPSGGALAHVQVGGNDPVQLMYHPDQVQAVMEGGALPGFLGSLLNMIPIVGPLLGSVLGGSGLKGSKKSKGGLRKPNNWSMFLKANMKTMKLQHPSASHAEIMQMLGNAYRGQ